MDKKQITTKIIEIIKHIEPSISHFVNGDAVLVGEGQIMDSVKLVQLCVELEDNLDEEGLSFDWTSPNAMSRSRSMFRTVDTLASEILSQNNQK